MPKRFSASAFTRALTTIACGLVRCSRAGADCVVNQADSAHGRCGNGSRPLYDPDLKEDLEDVGLKEFLRDNCSLTDMTFPAVCLVLTGKEPMGLENGHWVVVTGAEAGRVEMMDPLKGLVSVPQSQFEWAWHDKERNGRLWMRPALDDKARAGWRSRAVQFRASWRCFLG